PPWVMHFQTDSENPFSKAKEDIRQRHQLAGVAARLAALPRVVWAHVWYWGYLRGAWWCAPNAWVGRRLGGGVFAACDGTRFYFLYEWLTNLVVFLFYFPSAGGKQKCPANVRMPPGVRSKAPLCPRQLGLKSASGPSQLRSKAVLGTS